jgi:hypothetical protein
LRAKKLASAIIDLGFSVGATPLRIQESVTGAVVFIHGLDSESRIGMVSGSSCAPLLSVALEHALLEAYAQLMVALRLQKSDIQHTWSGNVIYTQPSRARELLAAWHFDIAARSDFAESRICVDGFPAICHDRGNVLTEWLSLAVCEVEMPTLWPASTAPVGPNGILYPFA